LRRNIKNNEGISLLELIIVMGILSIMLFGVINIFRGESKEAGLWRAAEVIQADVRYVRNRAVRHGMRHRISFDVNTNTYTVYYETNNGFQLLRTENIYQNVLLNFHNFPSAGLTFTARGTATPAGRIELRNSFYELTVTFTSGTGTANIQEIVKH